MLALVPSSNDLFVCRGVIDRWRTWIFVVDFDVPMLINVQSAAHLLDRHVKV